MTGPSAANDGSMYAYIEASGKQEGDVAYLESTVNIPGKTLMPKYMPSVKTGGK